MSKHRNSPQGKPFVNYSIDDLKNRACGRWIEILQAAGMPLEMLESRRGMPCPRCGGRDRFGVMRDLAQRGAVLCRHCFNSTSNPKAGDGIATLRWWLGLSLPDAIQWLGEYLGGGLAVPRVHEIVQSIHIPQVSDPERFEMLADTWYRAMKPHWRDKAAMMLGLPSDPLVRLRVGWSDSHRASSWPMRNGAGDAIGIRLRCPRTAKKWSVKGSANGLFYSSSLLKVERPKRLWIVEGFTDTAAMLSLGLDVVGCPSAGGGGDLLIDLGRSILPQEIVIIADADDAGSRGAERIAKAVKIVAPCRIVSPPNGLKDARNWVCSGASRELIESTADAVTMRRVVMEDM